MYPLAACSVLLIAAVIYRMFNMKKSLICPAVLTRAVEQYTRGAVGRTELERIAEDSDSVEGRLVLDALNSPLEEDRKSTRLNSSHSLRSRMPSSA